MENSHKTLSCTAFDAVWLLARGPYAAVAVAVKERLAQSPHASVLIFDDGTGKQIDFDLRGTDQEIADRIARQFSGTNAVEARPVGRPKLGVVSREITLLPKQWEWLGEQPGGASATLRRLVEEARRGAPTPQALMRKMHERTYTFMSAMAGDLPHFEDASRALFANDTTSFRESVAGWPADIVAHIERLRSSDGSGDET